MDLIPPSNANEFFSIPLIVHMVVHECFHQEIQFHNWVHVFIYLFIYSFLSGTIFIDFEEKEARIRHEYIFYSS